MVEQVCGDRTVDPAEVAKFSAIAAEWWDQDGKFAPLHRLNPTRLAFIRDEALKLLSLPGREGAGGGRSDARSVYGESVEGGVGLSAPPRPLPPPRAGSGILDGLRVLDLGCGGGLVSVPLARLGAAVTGADASEETIAAAKAYAAEAGVEVDYLVATAESLAGEAPAVRYDLVLALEIVEHVADVGAFLSACGALVRPGGKLIVSTINRTQKARLFAIVGAERFLRWVPEDTHHYDKLVTPEELERAAPELAWDAPVGISFDPVRRTWALSRDVSVNYFRTATKR